MDSRPLVSVCVKCYNNASYIGQTLKSVVAQTYRPLEIVISDDASTDDSVKVIDEVISEYRIMGGDIPIRFNKCEHNLGILGNWHKLCQMANGDLFVKQDGDDVSTPDRVEKIVAAWLRDGCRAVVISHSGYKMDQRGCVYARMRTDVIKNGPHGAFSAYSRKLVDLFPDIDWSDRISFDDNVYGIRARIAGHSIYIPDRLLSYRIGSGPSSGVLNYRRFMARGLRSEIAATSHGMRDLDAYSGDISNTRRVALRGELVVRRESAVMALGLFDGATLRERMAAWKVLRQRSANVLHRMIQLLLLLGNCSDILFNLLGWTQYKLLFLTRHIRGI